MSKAPHACRVHPAPRQAARCRAASVVIVGDHGSAIGVVRHAICERRHPACRSSGPCGQGRLPDAPSSASSMPSVMARPSTSFIGASTIGEPTLCPTMIFEGSPSLPLPSVSKQVRCTARTASSGIERTPGSGSVGCRRRQSLLADIRRAPEEIRVCDRKRSGVAARLP